MIIWTDWAEFFVDTQGWPGSVLDKNRNLKKIYFFQFFFVHGQRRALLLVYNIFTYIVSSDNVFFPLKMFWYRDHTI